MAYQKASFMAEPSVAFDTPDLAETLGFLRRFAELMSNGYNAAYLRRACELLETLAARAIAAPNAESPWRFKYESLTRHADALQAECDALKDKIDSLEARRAERRSAFNTINGRNQTIEARAVAGGDVCVTSATNKDPGVWRPQGRTWDPAAVEASVLVPETALRQARAQFEYLAREFVPLGDIASQVMCELAAYTMDVALFSGQQKDHPAAGEVAQSILASRSSNQR